MKAKHIFAIVGAAVVVILIALSIFSTFFTDYWWFSSLGFSSVFWTKYKAEYLLWFIGFLSFLLLINLNLSIALRSKSNLTVDPRIADMLKTFGKYFRMAVYGGAALLAFIMAGALSDGWMNMLTYVHAEGFGISDPVFGNDVGFYFFKLPFIISLKNWLLATIVLVLIATIVVYMFRQGVSFAFGRLAISDQARKHLAILIGLVFVLMSAGYYLGRYDILYSSRSGSFYGAGYSDIHAQLPASWIMVVVSILVGVFFVRALYARQVKFLLRIVIGFIVLAILVTGVFPSLMQKFIVDPNEQSKEREYISNNIEFTRLAYGLNRITEKTIEPKYSLGPAEVRDENETIRNIMLWDYRPLASTLDQLQVIRLYYDFPDVDIDRYKLNDGSYRQVMLSARELNQDKLPPNARTWVNLNLVYTHGYGLGMSPVNVVTKEGLPEFFVKDIPPVSDVGIEITRPEIYIGEKTETPVIVNGNIEEFDYPLGDVNQMATYGEDAGVKIGSFFRRLLFAIHFGDLNILISGYIKPESKILYVRQIQNRVRKLAPYLSFDEDPYLVAADGRLYWIYDAYTTSSKYPYSKPYDRFNYIRNSTKIVIDAYTGDTRFYKFGEETDPMIRVYERIFPDLYDSREKMPKALWEHVRYPQDLFDIQAEIYQTYHMLDPQVFYNKEDLWNIANEKLQENIVQMESYYAIMRLPGEDKAEFIQMLPYTPNKRDNMIAWLCARSDDPNYGKMLVYKFPKKDLTYGPMQVSARIDQDPDISQQLTLWNQQGSSVTRGNLLVIPIQKEVMYVQPVYLQATSGKLPELKRVIVSYGNRIAMEATLDQALDMVFGGTTASAKPEDKSDRTVPLAGTAPATSTTNLSRSALDHYNRAERYLKDGNWAKYGAELELLKKDLERMAGSGGQ